MVFLWALEMYASSSFGSLHPARLSVEEWHCSLRFFHPVAISGSLVLLNCKMHTLYFTTISMLMHGRCHLLIILCCFNFLLFTKNQTPPPTRAGFAASKCLVPRACARWNLLFSCSGHIQPCCCILDYKFYLKKFLLNYESIHTYLNWDRECFSFFGLSSVFCKIYPN